MADAKISSGVQEFIDKLKNQGVDEGQKQAKKIIEEANNQASRILAQAQSKADQLLSDARRQLEIERKSSHEAIKTALRDTEIALRAKVREAFSAHLKKLVSLELKDKQFIRELVIAVAGIKTNEITQASHVEVLIPAKIFETNETGEVGLSKEGKKRLQHLVLGISHEMLREGIELTTSVDVKGGIRVRLLGDDIDIDLTDEALSDLILKYLLPRYREIISGNE